MLRILLATDFYPPHIGGAERQAQQLAEMLTKRGHCVRVVTLEQTGLPGIDETGQIKIYRLPAAATRVPWFSGNPDRRFHPPFPDPLFVRGLRALIAEFQPDVVHGSGWIAYSCAEACDGNVPLLISVRDYGYSCPTRTMLYEGAVCSGPAFTKCFSCAVQKYGIPKAGAALASVAINKQLLQKRVTAIHSVSSYVRTVVQRDLWTSSQPVPELWQVQIPDFVTAATFSEESNAVSDLHLCRLPDQPYILFVGALQPHKGVNLLLDAYERLHNAPPLVLIGSVWKDTPQPFPGNVIVLENIPHTAVMQAWNRALFGVFPSIWPDPLPGVVREAMSRAKPVIATAVGGNTDMVEHEVSGLLVSPDVISLAVAMQKLIDDRALREKMGKVAAESVRRIDNDAIAAQFEALYIRVTEAHHAVRAAEAVETGSGQ